MEKLVRTDDDRFKRDVVTGAVINTDDVGYQQFLREREQQFRIQEMTREIQRTQEQTTKVEMLAKEVSDIKTDMNDIKKLLQALVNGR